MPVEIAGKATDRHPRPAAISIARRCAEASSSGSPALPPRHTGPTAWITYRAGSAPAPVATASPVGQPPMMRHSARIVRPAGPLDRPVDSAAPGQSRVGGIHDRVHRLGGDVALHEFEVHGRGVSGRPGGVTYHQGRRKLDRGGAATLERAIEDASSGHRRPGRIPADGRERRVEQRRKRMIVKPGDTHVGRHSQAQVPAGGVHPAGDRVGEGEHRGGSRTPRQRLGCHPSSVGRREAAFQERHRL